MSSNRITATGGKQEHLVSVRFTSEELEAFYEMCRKQHRRPPEQMRYLIARELEREALETAA